MSLLTPVRYPVKYYKWDDDQAPQLTDADGVIKTILKACLITGYGDKAGAGWAARFEDDSRIVLRRPLQIGNPLDIKIENGVVNGQTSHRIVGQMNPTGLDDINELSSTNLVARDNKCGKDWHLIATDFGFVLCYQMHHEFATVRNHMIYVGGMQNIRADDTPYFYVSHDHNVMITGKLNQAGSMPLVHTASQFKNLLTNQNAHLKHLIKDYPAGEMVGGEYFVQQVILDAKVVMPFFWSVGGYKTTNDESTKKVMVAGRSMLRYVNRLWNFPTHYTYIPLDYWEL